MPEANAVTPDPQRCDPPPLFKPREPRRRTFLSGKLVYGDAAPQRQYAFTLDCAIRDLSEGGAKISFAQRQPLPTDVFLIVVKQGIAYRAKVMWMKHPARGLSFSEAYLLKGLLPEKLRHLRYLWAGLDSRAGSDAQAHD